MLAGVGESLTAIIERADAENPDLAELLREDCRSISESAPYMVRWGEQGSAMICPRCGTPVARVPEGRAEDGTGRRYLPAVWESRSGRKHTIRRCDWRGDRPALTARYPGQS